MRIIDLQRRLREVGRIRIGEQVVSANGKTRPAKIEHFRLTSRDKTVIEAAAVCYSGTVEPWEAPDGPQWEVKTGVDQMPVVVPPGDMAFTQAYEQWSAGGCKVRCDGQWDHLADKECHCDPENRACKIHSRLSVILPDLPGFGVWRLDTLGWYAAVELGGVVDICAAYSARGAMLPARLRLEQRSVKRFQADGTPLTMRFAVPVLDLDVHPLALTEKPLLTPVPELDAADVPTVADQLSVEIVSGRKRTQARIPATGLEPRQVGGSAPSPAGLLCALCGETLAGSAVAIVAGKKTHKGGCPAVPAISPAGDESTDGHVPESVAASAGESAT